MGISKEEKDFIINEINKPDEWKTFILFKILQY